MIRTLRSTGGGFQRILPIAPTAVEGAHWVTVFIAENGGRKSYLLRCLTEAALGNSFYRSLGKPRVNFTLPETKPARVIAISGTPLDRFPRAGTRDLGSRRKSSSYNNSFVYLGQRASNGMSGLGQSERSLVGSLLSNRHLLKERSELFSQVFGHLGLEPFVAVYLRSSLAGRHTEKLLTEVLYSKLKEAVDTQGPTHRESKALVQEIEHFLHDRSVRQKTLSAIERLSQGRPALTLTPQRSTPLQGLSVAMWELLLIAGAVEIVRTKFKRKGRTASAMLTGDELSSGQWSWLGTFGALVAELRDDSLILVDEPENSLHPSWQRAFMPELYGCLRAFNNCQIVVATHSPLIASGVSPDWGNVRTLKRGRRANAVVRSEELVTPFGWHASDVYDELFELPTTRSGKFLEVANMALAAISARKPISATDVAEWSEHLQNSMTQLPPFDPLRQVFADIIKTLGPRRGRRHISGAEAH